MSRTILVVDDEVNIVKSLEGILTDEGYDVICAHSGKEALTLLEEEAPDLALLDIWMPGIDGLETLTRIKQDHPYIQVVMISGHGNIETAVKAIKLGAYDFIEKPLSLDKILLTINNALKYHRLEEENILLKSRTPQHNLTGASQVIQTLKEQVVLVAPTDAWVLITGENGTGKEVVARSIHRLSKRAQKPFIDVNCAAIPEELIESELFGHEKGAFTGAATRRRGKFDLANEGTLFLDEIADMSLKTQSKILRILQEQKFERVGGAKTIKVDVRVIAATNKNLEEEISRRTFREDLYYRLNVIPILVPPLRWRREDIPALIQEFLEEYSYKIKTPVKQLTPEALDLLLNHPWPGNVRELKNFVERLVIMTPSRTIEAGHVPPPIGRTPVPAESAESFNFTTFKDARSHFERMFIAQKLAENNYNVSQTAEVIGLERSHLHKKIKAYGLDTGKTTIEEG
ncbi:MAG: sigma-54-dependent Fis family transcriptional regulator [Deltaproteobacteria bacterium]|nr:sigma-54-dependent Fis family transcriptional regulator [Deltaproteobacteria bacterium]